MKRLLAQTTVLLLVGACSSGGGGDDAPANSIPSITAEADKSADESTNVSLTATLIDTDGDASVSWTQLEGPIVTLSTTQGTTTSFRAPVVPQDLDLIFRVMASDGAFTATDTVTITVIDKTPDGGSSQDITGNEDERKKARDKRNKNRPLVDSREVRTFDGTNNNLTNTLWGASFIHLQRMATADYSDDISEMAGVLRPSARVISNTVVAQEDGVSIPNTFGKTDFVWQWGQFIDHDIDLTDGVAETEDIAVPLGDIWFDPDGLGDQVIPFSRALYDDETGLALGNPREQENEITSWIDGSMVYGSSEERSLALRVSEDSPFLKTSDGNLLPFNVDSLSNANGFVTDPTTLFLAGDVRVNEQIGLTVMHTLFVREHNRLATQIQANNPNSTAEAVYQQARRMVIATIQKITFEEWLPALIGSSAIPAYSGYDDTINSSIFNEFSVAAFRLGHSMINDQLLRVDASGAEISAGHLELFTSFFTGPDILTSETSIDPILRGLASQAHQKLDPYIVHDLRNFLFGAPGVGGFDLASLNIQRGRDHGVPSYNDMRAAMGLSRVSSFSDITSDTTIANALFEAYGSVDDMDLWVGGLAEEATGESQLGPLFTTILATQFAALRDGDRFWYQSYLTADELDRLANVTLAQVIRNNTSIGSELQANVFEVKN